MKYTAIILAAGTGDRCDGFLKPFFPVNGKPILEYLIERFTGTGLFDEIVAVVPESMLSFCEREVSIRCVVGGTERIRSIQNGINAVPKSDHILLHDGARPYISSRHLLKMSELYEKSARQKPVYTTLAFYDFVMLDDKDLLRDRLLCIQPPTLFPREKLEAAMSGLLCGTSESDSVETAYIEWRGVKLCCPLEGINHKITVYEDLLLAEAYLK